MTLFENFGYSKPERTLMLLIMLASMFDGMTQGIMLLQETIAKKALLASDYQISLIGVIANATMVFSFFISYFFTNKSKKSLLLWGYLLGRFLFVFSFLIADSSVFLLFLFFFHALYSIQVPVLKTTDRRRQISFKHLIPVHNYQGIIIVDLLDGKQCAARCARRIPI